jgi:glycosyltransferase involved in cell wall biosynthesis
VNYLVINQEFLTDWDLAALTSGRAVALCKTRFAQRFLADSLGIDSILLGFTSPNSDGGPHSSVLGCDPKPLVLHIAGESSLKGTLAVLRGWAAHRGRSLNATLLVVRRPADFERAPADLEYWDSLNPTQCQFPLLGGVECWGNVLLTRRWLSPNEHAQLMSAAAVHLCPSLVEGFGHTINQARALGGLIVTTNAQPMNELIDTSCGILVPIDVSGATTMRALNPTQAHNYPPAIAEYPAAPVDEAALMAAVRHALAMSVAEKAKLGDAARARFAATTTQFTETLSELLRIVD